MTGCRAKTSLRQKIALVFLGVFLFLVILEAGMRASGFLLLKLQERRNLQEIKREGFRIMCLGESTSVIGGADSYPAILGRILNQRNIGVRFNVVNCAVASVDTSYILAHLDENLRKYNPHMVIAMMGINDGEDYILRKSKNISSVKDFLNSLKIYKLFDLILLHVSGKIQEMALYKDKGKNQPAAVDYSNEGNYSQAEITSKKETPPASRQQYLADARSYERQDKFLQAVEMYKKAIELDPAYSMAYVELAWCYQQLQEYAQAEKMFLEAAKIDRNNPEAYIGLGYLAELQGKYAFAEEMFEKAPGLNPKYDHRYYRFLAGLYNIIGEHDRADIYSRLLNQPDLYNPLTQDNYNKLKDILDKKRIQLVCVQYPLRNPGPLKKMFSEQKGIIFVDNEKIFKDALRQADYREYFIDFFAGDFGHCTDKGNRLLAENIADVILKEVFGR